MSVAVDVQGLGKKYLISKSDKQQYNTFRDRIYQLFIKKDSNSVEEFWALKDISFKVKKGERVGIIGRNGAGKSTLLKILSKITDLTEGRIEIKGKVASLLEVGTGFHPELTGRENIYLNGSILGMSRDEINAKMEEIISFAEIEKFLDVPVKRYSSGMTVRLAFSVAAHLEPEILVVDEVLAVGDAAFQKKCLGKMEDVAQKGRTVLFVSHQMEAIDKLCDSCVLLENGKFVMHDETSKVIDAYLSASKKYSEVDLSCIKSRHGEGRIRFTKTWIENGRGEKTPIVKSGDSIKIVAEYELVGAEPIANPAFAFAVNTIRNVAITDLSNFTAGDEFHEHEIPNKGKVVCEIPSLTLNTGSYYFNVLVRTPGAVEDWITEAFYFDVEAGDFFKSGNLPDTARLILMNQDWKLDFRDQ
ncbi:MAG: ABC transporter ATP-binding protein [Flavobacteriales bacterium]|jgi:lipopolysaccharide transport system ATP-binding protein|nr:ABC transporter ATP-binding protein [Flavobacteriales bacterium]MBT6745974.1 ABC transporter ATP-binding protein [Flavobacteriales bacterium]